MDFETFGEHQWTDTGIFQFFEAVVEKFLGFSWNRFVRPSEVMIKAKASELPTYRVDQPISWADIDRDVSAWRDNDLQYDTLRTIYELEPAVRAAKNQKLLEDWRKLQTSDHFYYMCVKWSQDGDVHAYFSPYEGPFEAYVRYSTVLADLTERLRNMLPTTYKLQSTT
jgi:alpha-amylase